MESNTRNYHAHGGAEWVIGGKLTFLPGATVEGADGLFDLPTGTKLPAVADSEATTVAALREDYNRLLAAFDQLIGDINRMANALNTADEGAPAAKRILRAAAVPIDAQMKANASRDPKIISNKLHGAISTGKVKKHKTTGLHITIGVHRKDWNDEDYYPAYVEYGHGGPAPAPAHPYVRPAFDTRQDEAFGIIRDGLLNELRK